VTHSWSLAAVGSSWVGSPLGWWRLRSVMRTEPQVVGRVLAEERGAYMAAEVFRIKPSLESCQPAGKVHFEKLFVLTSVLR
jgi:hypothetical protein